MTRESEEGESKPAVCFYQSYRKLLVYKRGLVQVSGYLRYRRAEEGTASVPRQTGAQPCDVWNHRGPPWRHWASKVSWSLLEMLSEQRGEDRALFLCLQSTSRQQKSADSERT